MLLQIQEAIRANHIRFTEHADDEAQADQLTYDEILFTALKGEVIRQYPDDKPYPSCLVLGFTFTGQAIHSVWAYNKETQWAVLITVYRPDPALWINFRTRKASK